MWIYEMLKVDLSDSAFGFVRSFRWICQKTHVNFFTILLKFAEAAFGLVISGKWIYYKLNVDLSEVSYGFVEECMLICQKLYVDISEADC